MGPPGNAVHKRLIDKAADERALRQFMGTYVPKEISILIALQTKNIKLQINL